MNKWDKIWKIHTEGKGEADKNGNGQKGVTYQMAFSLHDFIKAWGFLRPPMNVKRMNPDAVMPTRGTKKSAGLDLYAINDVEIMPGDIVKIPTGWAFEIPNGFYGLLVTRSSLGKDGIRIAAGANIIDSDYRNEVFCFMRNDGIYPRTIRKGERYAQIVFTPVLMANLIEVDDLSETDRKGGFGSTGK